jgi:hypothetical protein
MVSQPSVICRAVVGFLEREKTHLIFLFVASNAIKANLKVREGHSSAVKSAALNVLLVKETLHILKTSKLN